MSKPIQQKQSDNRQRKVTDYYLGISMICNSFQTVIFNNLTSCTASDQVILHEMHLATYWLFY